MAICRNASEGRIVIIINGYDGEDTIGLTIDLGRGKLCPCANIIMLYAHKLSYYLNTELSVFINIFFHVHDPLNIFYFCPTA